MRARATYHKAKLVKRDVGYDMNVNGIEKDFFGKFRNGTQESYRWISVMFVGAPLFRIGVMMETFHSHGICFKCIHFWGSRVILVHGKSQDLNNFG